MKTVNDVRIASLFSNVGIAESYLNQNNIKTLVANEVAEDRARYYSYMHPNTDMLCGDITEKTIYQNLVTQAKNLDCNFILATPPCQGMSNAGKRDINDKRNELIKYVIHFIIDTDAPYALIENVPSMPNFLINHHHHLIKIKNYIYDCLSEKYNIQIEVLNTADFGVPQTRKRAFVAISKKGYKKFKLNQLPKTKKITVKEAIGHLPPLESAEKSKIPYHFSKTHNENHILWLKHTPTGKTALDNEVFYPKKDGRKIKGYKTTYKRMEWDKPAPTITMANGSVSSQNNIHPGVKMANGTYNNARVLTLKEIFILSSLPDNYNPPDFASENLIRKVIGEGIPPLIVKKVIDCIL